MEETKDKAIPILVKVDFCEHPQLQIFGSETAEPITWQYACLAEQPLTGSAGGWNAQHVPSHLKNNI